MVWLNRICGRRGAGRHRRWKTYRPDECRTGWHARPHPEDEGRPRGRHLQLFRWRPAGRTDEPVPVCRWPWRHAQALWQYKGTRSEEHTSELQSLMRISYAVSCLKKKKRNMRHGYTSPIVQLTTK